MSKPEQQYHRLPPLQRRIILHLSEDGPQTINETKKKISSHYKPTWVAFNSLERKGLIQKVSLKTYRGREYPEFWITQRGTLVALSNDANFERVKQNSLTLCKDKGQIRDLETWFELIKVVGPEIAFNYVEVVEGKLELKAISIEPEKALALINIGKKHPEVRRKLNEFFNLISDMMGSERKE